jgi:hypothetical protein
MKMLAFLHGAQTPSRGAPITLVARPAGSGFSAHNLGGHATELP